MKNLKKALCLVLAVTMIMGLMVVGTSAADFTDKGEIVNKDAVNVMSALNIINGKGEGKFDPKGIVTRAEMAKMICVALNGGRDPQLGTSAYSFTDTQGHWAAGYIEYCYNLGIISGRNENIFDPNGTVTGTEAAKMLLVALGYDAQLEGFVGARWDVNVNVRASQKNLYAGLPTLNPSAGLSRDDAAQVIYNALNAYTVKYNYQVLPGADGQWVTKSVAEDTANTVLATKFGLKFETGIVTSVGQYVVSGGTAGKDSFIVALDAGGNETYTNYAGAADIIGLAGQHVNVLYKQPVAGGIKTVYGVYATSKNKVVTAQSTYVAKKDGKVTINSAPYEAEAGVLASVPAAAVPSADMYTFIDRTGDGKFDIVLIDTVAVEKVTFVGSTFFNTNANSYTSANVLAYSGMAAGDYAVKTIDKYTGKVSFAKATTVQGTVTGLTKYLTLDMIELSGAWYWSAYNTSWAAAVSFAGVSLGSTQKAAVVGGVIYAIEAIATPVESTTLVYLANVGSSVSDPFPTVPEAKYVKLALADGTVSTAKAVLWNGTTKSALTNSSTNAGKLYTYFVKDDVYYLTAAPTDVAGVKALGYSGAVIGASVDTATDKMSTAFIADDAVFFVQYGKASATSYTTLTDLDQLPTVKVITGAQVKAWGDASYGNTGRAIGYTTTVNGLPQVKLGVLVFDSETLAGSEYKYGYIVSNPANVKVGSEYFTQFQLWDGTSNLTLQFAATNSTTINPNINYGTFIKYQDLGNGKIASPTYMGAAYYGGVVGFDGKNILINGIPTITSVATDVEIITFNSVTLTGAQGGTIQVAPMLGLNSNIPFKNIVVLEDNGSGVATKVAVDVANKIYYYAGTTIGTYTAPGSGAGTNSANNKIGLSAAALADATGATAAAEIMGNFYINNVLGVDVTVVGGVPTTAIAYDLNGVPSTTVYTLVNAFVGASKLAAVAADATLAQIQAAADATLTATKAASVTVTITTDSGSDEIAQVGDVVTVVYTAANGLAVAAYTITAA